MHTEQPNDQSKVVSTPMRADVGFYRPDPGCERSPSVVMGVNPNGHLRVFELRTHKVSLLNAANWMTAAEMMASTHTMSEALAPMMERPENYDPIMGRHFMHRLGAIRVAQTYIEKHLQLAASQAVDVSGMPPP